MKIESFSELLICELEASCSDEKMTVNELLSEHSNLLESAASRFAEQFEYKWIDCSIELPKNDKGIFLISCENGVTTAEFTRFPNLSTMWFAVKTYGSYEDCFCPENVTHWQPLPEAP